MNILGRGLVQLLVTLLGIFVAGIFATMYWTEGSELSLGWKLASGAVYLAPWLIARVRRHPRVGLIAGLGFFLGWTGVFWVVALAWACGDIHAIGVAPEQVSGVSPTWTATCPSCRSRVHPDATVCPQCRSDLARRTPPPDDDEPNVYEIG